MLFDIAAGSGMTILPEQQGNWSYAQQDDRKIQQEGKPDYVIVWRRGGTPSMNMPLESDRTIE